MIETIQQGLGRLDDLSLDEVGTLLSSSYEAFDAAEAEGNSEDMKAYLSAARQFKDRRTALLAAGGSDGNAPEATETAEAPAESVTADAGEPPAETAETPAETPVTADAGEPPAETETPAEPVTAAADADTPEAPAAEPEPTSEAVTASDTSETPPAEPAENPPAEAVEASADQPEPAPEAERAVAASTEGEAEPTTPSEETTVTASASVETIEVPEDNKPVAVEPPSTVLAGADVQGVSAGAPFKDKNQVGQAMIHRIRAVQRVHSGGDGERHTVATIVASYPEDRILDGDTVSNEAKINDVLHGEAVVASGGYCAPLPVRYDIYGLGVTDRPVRDALPMFAATRGGVKYVEPPKLGDLSAAVGLWTAVNDADPGSDGPATKAELKVECADEVDAVADAVTLQLEFGNFMTRAFPELVNRNNELALIEHARFAELTLLSKMAALSTDVTASAKLGIGRDFLYSLGKAAAAYRTRHRMRRTSPLRVIAPGWVLDAMREDFAQGLPGDEGLAYADSQISQFINARNVRVSWHIDGVFDAQGGTEPLVEFPDEFQWFIFSEGTFLYLDGGTLDLGVVRDSGLVSTNDYKTFTETFEGVAKLGVEALVVTQENLIDGAVVGTITPANEGP